MLRKAVDLCSSVMKEVSKRESTLRLDPQKGRCPEIQDSALESRVGHTYNECLVLACKDKKERQFPIEYFVQSKEDNC